MKINVFFKRIVLFPISSCFSSLAETLLFKNRRHFVNRFRVLFVKSI